MGNLLSACREKLVTCFGGNKNPAETTVVLPDVKHVAVIGGGLAGLICAYYCAKKGQHVEIFERRDTVGAGTAYGPAGVTMWKPVRRGLKFLGTVDPLAGGLGGLQDYVEGTAWQALDPDPRRPALMLEARKAHAEFLKENPDAKPIMHDEGLMYVLDEELFKENQKLFKDDPSMIFFTKAEFEKSEWFCPLYEGCNYYGILLSKEEGAIDPHRFVQFLAKKVESMGGKIYVNTTVSRLDEIDTLGKVVVHPSVSTTKFDAAIVSVGAARHPGDLLEASGIEDPVDEIYGVKGYTVTGRMPPGFLKTGFVDAVDTKFIRPWTDKDGNFCIRAGSIADPFDKADPLAINWDRLDEFKNNQFMKKVFDSVGDTRGVDADTVHDAVVEKGKLEVWTGIRPVNRHGRVPIFRWANGTKRVLVVSGFGSNGYVMCWHTGPRVARLMG